MKLGEVAVDPVPDPVQRVRIEPSAQNPLLVTVTIELSEHVASCCVNAEEAYVEFHKDGAHIRSSFEFRESRPSHLFQTTLALPESGRYLYRIFAKILGRVLNREGIYDV